MYTLYIDTHFIDITLGLFFDGKLVDKKIIKSNSHSEYTINLLDSLLKDNNILISNISEIIVINGPGSFTGVRIGVVIAKIIGYTKNIPVKTLSYLQALSLNYSGEVVLGIKDKNGIFIGEFSNQELTCDYFYLNNKELNTYDKEIIIDNNVDLQKVYDYMVDKNAVDIHLFKPLYVKRIEVEKC